MQVFRGKVAIIKKMYSQPSKRQLLIQRSIIYGLMGVIVIGLVTVLVFVMLGYQFNRSDGRIEQGGLVQFESQPSGADVFIDGVNLGARTTTKTTTTAGEHFIKMEHSGYQSWQKSVSVAAGSILWLNYARLIPNERPVTEVVDLATVSSTAASPDYKWMAIKEDPITPVLLKVDLTRDEVKVSTIELPAEAYTKPINEKSQVFSVQKWDPSSRYLLVKHDYDGKTEWLVVDMERPENTKNITALLAISPSKITFSNENGMILYALIDNNIRKIDLNEVTLSATLVGRVADFDLYDTSVVTYVSLPDPATKSRSVGYYHDGAKKPRTIRTFNDDGILPIHFRIDKYFDTTYAAISYGETIDVLQGELPRSDTERPSVMKPAETMTVPGGIRYLSTKTNGRLIVAQVGATYTVYDMELKKMTSTTLKGASEITKELDWLDSYMIWSDSDGMVRFYEFDGANQHDIMPVLPGYSVTLNPNGKYVYGINKSNDGKFHLQRVQLQTN